MTEVDHTIVSIRFSGKDMDPKKIGDLLGFIGSESTKSIIKKLKSGRINWSIELVDNGTSPIEKKIESLLDNFTGDINRWKVVTENIKANIFCGIFLDGWNRGFSLNSKLMKKLSDRNLEIGFDIYSPTDSWDS